MKVAELFVKCLEEEHVEVIFGLPGEENIDVMDALRDSSIRFILTRHEQGASFMADIYGRLTGKAGVCLATLGPGAINLTLGAADAQLDSSPLVAIAGQASCDRLFKEFHQVIDLVEMFRPISKWGSNIMLAETTPEIVRKAFKLAQSGRPGTTVIVLPEDIAKKKTEVTPLRAVLPKAVAPIPAQVERAVQMIHESKNPIILAGHGVCRSGAADALSIFAEHLRIPVANTFMAKGVIPDDNEMSVGTIGFMRHDYVNFGFDDADLVITVGYDLVEYAPTNWNPKCDKKIIHIATAQAEVDVAYDVNVGVLGDIRLSLDAIQEALDGDLFDGKNHGWFREKLHDELARHAEDPSFPMKPQRMVGDIRKAMGTDDIVLCDTGALKMWVSRLYPCYQPDTCIFSNGLGTMGFAVPGALAAKLAHPDKRILAVTGDGSFLMNSQELETAKRENLPFVVLIFKDDHYGLIEWKQNLEFGRPSFVTFDNPDFVKYAESFGIVGYRVEKADDLLPMLNEALDSGKLAVIECPVDYSENTKLTDMLEALEGKGAEDA